MPLNLLKKYNQLLDLEAMAPSEKNNSLMGIFNRDIVNNSNFHFKSKPIKPTPQDGEIKMSTLFTHLTTEIEDKKERNRIFDIHRAKRLHWLKFHIEEQKKDNMLVFSVNEPEGIRTYVYDKEEKYVIVLEPLRKQNEYYLLTAYYLRGKDIARDKFEKKYKRKLEEVY
jgi:hypothetical protein